MTGTFLMVLAGLVLGNFTYAAFAGGEYVAAIERSFFSAIALLALWLAFAVRGWLS